jgi:GTP-binding protein
MKLTRSLFVRAASLRRNPTMNHNYNFRHHHRHSFSTTSLLSTILSSSQCTSNSTTSLRRDGDGATTSYISSSARFITKSYSCGNVNDIKINRHHYGESRMFSTAAAADSDSDDDDDNDTVILRNRSGVRNVAIIAHVDHGKTTLVDQLLRSAAKTTTKTAKSHNDGSNDGDDDATERLLDCGDLEKERGITITSKVTRIDEYYPTTNDTNDSGNSSSTIINLVDTPGHADFCGEVDRILSLVDGVCLVVDAGEGPMAQTKYVLSRALQARLPIVVVLNKVDRRISFDRVIEGDTEISLEELMEQLGASEEQIRFSLDKAMFYASARDGWVTQDLDTLRAIVDGDDNNNTDNIGMTVLLDKLLELIPEPSVRVYNKNNTTKSISTADSNDNPSFSTSTSMMGEDFVNDKFSLAAVTVGYDSYLGRTCTGRIASGHVTVNDSVTVLRRLAASDNDDSTTANATVTPPTTLKGLFVNKGISRVPLESQIAYAGDIVTLAGVPDSIRVGDTITGINDGGNERQVSQPIDTPPLVPPTLSMEFAANNGPLAGLEGTEVTPSKLRNRLVAETDNNVTLNVETSATDSERTNVFARGELQLGILIEQMRREGFEMVISPPNIVTTTTEADENGNGGGVLMEPFEEVTIDVDSEYAGYIVSALTADRKGILLEMTESTDSKTRLVLEVPSRGLLGFPSEAASATRGSAVVNHVFIEDRKYVGPLGNGLEKGKLISSDSGKATTYALSSLEARGVLFIAPGDVVYPGMIIGENAKQGDMVSLFLIPSHVQYCIHLR